MESEASEPSQALRTRFALTPTDIANYTYCPRLFKLSKLHADRRALASIYLVWGLFEHEIFRTLCTLLKTTWARLTIPDAITVVSTSDIETAVQHATKLIEQNYPHLLPQIESAIPELRYRLDLWLGHKQREIRISLKRGKTLDHAVSVALPWKIEEKLMSKRLDLYGRSDAIYSDGQAITPEDIKTSDGRFTTLVHQESHQAQLLCYSVMAEEKYGLPSRESRIFFSKDLSYSRFILTDRKRVELEQKITEARDLITEDIPSMLKGEETIKCRHCYMHDLCFEIENKKQEMNAMTKHEWLDRLLRSGELPADSKGVVK